MKRIAILLLLSACLFPASALAHSNNPAYNQDKASLKAQKKQLKAQKKYLKAQRKAQNKMFKNSQKKSYYKQKAH
ncbi:MAG TPA: hypothetical protein VMH04_00200 [Candidatus Solibacter sp.]|nr:hypothetical protein [Candidatus Solibacter sp.]